jgi:hypothetical protein
VLLLVPSERSFLDAQGIIVFAMAWRSRRSSYEEVAAALRGRDRLEAHRLREQTDVLRRRISGEAGAEAEVDEARIDVERERRIADASLAGGAFPATEPA